MKEKIKELFKEYYNDETMPAIELEDKVLVLFDVVGRSEQLVCDNHRPDLEHFMKYSESICKNCKQKV